MSVIGPLEPQRLNIHSNASQGRRGKQRDSCFHFFVYMSRKTIFFARLIVSPQRQKIQLVYKTAELCVFTSRVLFSVAGLLVVVVVVVGSRKICHRLQPPVTQQVLRVGKVEKKRG